MKSFIAIIVVFAIAIVAGLSSGYDSAEAQADAAVAVAAPAPLGVVSTGPILIDQSVEFEPQPATVTESSYCAVTHAIVTTRYEFTSRIDLQR